MKKTATLDIYQDSKLEWRWRLKHGNSKILAASSEGFSDKAGTRRNFRRVQAAVAEAVEA